MGAQTQTRKFLEINLNDYTHLNKELGEFLRQKSKYCIERKIIPDEQHLEKTTENFDELFKKCFAETHFINCTNLEIQPAGYTLGGPTKLFDICFLGEDSKGEINLRILGISFGGKLFIDSEKQRLCYIDETDKKNGSGFNMWVIQ
jgi:hypothetical protein